MANLKRCENKEIIVLVALTHIVFKLWINDS